MRNSRLGLLGALALLACQGADDAGILLGSGGATASGSGGSTTSPGAGGASTTASGGQAPSGGAPASGGTTPAAGAASAGRSANGGAASGGAASGGAAAGGVATTGGAAGTAGAAGRNGGGGRRGTGGASAAGASAGGASAGGASAAGGGASTAGAGGCVQNLTCMLTAPPSTGDIHQDCVDRVNQFRTECACLPALARWTAGEACADQEAQYDSEQNSAHAGFIANICSSGQAQDECPGWGSNAQIVSGCLQQMWNEGPPPTATCTDTCYSAHGHFINMTSTTATKVACGFYTTPAGKVWSTQNFSR